VGSRGAVLPPCGKAWRYSINLCRGTILCLLVLACSRRIPESSITEKTPLYHTWHSLREREYGEPVHPRPEEIPLRDFLPWAGIVSHHLLAHEYIDAWFASLATMRSPRCFYILSPSHYGISLEPYSLTIGSWESGFGLVESDKDKVNKLAEALEVDMDPEVFQVEHGVSTLMPYIKKHFPDAKVAVIAYQGEPPVNIPIVRRLADVLGNEFTEEGKRENFLLISTDFSHHGNLEATSKRDANSMLYLSKPGGVSWNIVNCDNRPAIYILDRLGKNNLESAILYHTNSWEISNEWEDDVTSYFFGYFR